MDPSASTRIVLSLEYDGTDYFGFQWQSGVRTIQGTLEEAIFKLSGDRIRVLSASRTDTGVHAKGQVASFRTTSELPLGTIVKALNYYLPRDIAVKAAYRANDDFDVRRSAVSREYEYRIWNGPVRSPLQRRFAYFVPGPLDTELMIECCRYLVGEHDFTSFTTVEDKEIKKTVRTVERAELKRQNDLVIFSIEAKSFLHHQVRNTIGALVRVGQGKMGREEFAGLLERHEPGLAGPRAPAAGLCLMQVKYPASLGE